ncbi:hypothetical protein ACFYPZ_16225 [Streptomyces sp. NPDC005506]|uniref:hypothetical protein n=1 Tax=Streptomyces sp. NPDC005506 TaxID=3364718 RepID=UPI00367D443C
MAAVTDQLRCDAERFERGVAQLGHARPLTVQQNPRRSFAGIVGTADDQDCYRKDTR